MLRTSFTRRTIATSLAVGLLIVANALVACAPKAASAPNDKSGLQGTWHLSSGAAEGRALTANQLRDGKLEINGDVYTVSLPDRETATGTQTLDPTKRPKAIDITNTSGPTRGTTWLGIYEYNGDEFRVVFAAEGRPRPTTFATAPGSGQWMHVWRRTK